jgi:outer membrane protein OmpA-like peptidoglycan-associated protein
LLTAAIGVFVAGTAHAQNPASVCPDNFAAFADTTEPVACACTAEATARGSVWGMDIYTADSSVCRAALHAGVVAKSGGAVMVLPEAGRQAYPGVTRNGVSSSNHGSYRGSFRFAAAPAPAETPAAVPTRPPAASMASVCPDNFAAFADTTEPVACACTAEATANGSVWGMDIYTADSSVCRAALHAGVVPKSGGAVTVVPEAGRQAYPGVTRNGISSSNHGAYRASFRFAAVASAPAAAAPSQPAAATTASVCPDNFAAFADTTDPLACACTAEATARGSVWGMDVYTVDSSVCRAALHAGVVAKSGGAVTVLPEAGRPAYPGVTRNGISSSNHGAYRASFRFAAAVPAPAAAPAVVPSRPPAASTASVCPDNFAAYAETTDPVACGCTAEATALGSVWGMDVYTADSSVCRAALHAGVVAKSGGAVTVLPEAGRQAYPGVTRNGVSSSNHGAYRSSFRFAAAVQPVMIDNKPAQQPIAATIQATGQVQLYIQFRFNSAELDVDAAPTLMELREALNASPSLRLMLIGHTDSIGTPQYNRPLSYRRAQSVMGWLVAKGVSPTRLAVDGKGQDQPIADNGSDEGRALNRRVQALRVQ